MNIAILGSDPALLPLVQQIVASPDHHLTHLCEAGELAPQLMQLVPAVTQLASWEDLLQINPLDVVIVAGATDVVLTGAKQLATADVPLMVLPTAAQESTLFYELSLIQDGNQVPLTPCLPLLDEPAVIQLQKLLASKKIGNILHVQWERSFNTNANPTNLLTQKNIEQALLHDVALLRNVWGDYNQITAIYSGSEQDKYSLATVTLAGAELPEVVWTLSPTTDNITWKLTITSDQGFFTLEQSHINAPAVLRDGNGREIVNESDTNLVVPSLQALLHPQETTATWGDLIRTFETVDATRRSIRRRRTIDLYFESTSERSIFKTQMTAIGCCLLMVTLFLFVAVLFAGSLFHPPRLVMYILRGLIFLPLFVFLGMQLFIFLTRPASQ